MSGYMLGDNYYTEKQSNGLSLEININSILFTYQNNNIPQR